MIKSRLSIVMALQNIRTIKQIQIEANISWDILDKLMTNIDIDKMRMKNILKVCKCLNCKFEDLINIKYPYDTITLMHKSPNNLTNLKILMSLRDIDTQNELIKLTGVSWSVIKKISDGKDLETIELYNYLKICAGLNCKVEDLLNFNYEYEPIELILN